MGQRVQLGAQMMLKALLAVVLAFPVFHQDLPKTPEKDAELEAVATAVHRESKGDPRIAAMTLTIGRHESNYSSRICRSECRGRECDPRRLKGGALEYRARGCFQMHRNGITDAEWAALKGPGTIDAQVKEATRRVRSAFATCKKQGALGAIRAYAGRGCESPLKDEAARLATYEGIRRRL